ncbi:MAG: hypothetical protein ACFCVF_10150 [Kineosporiaceae bacterium]
MLRRHPQALAWLAERHVAAEAAAVTAAIATARADLAGAVGPRGVDGVLVALEREAALLLADRRAVGLVAEALSRPPERVP